MSKTFIIAEAALTWLHGGLEAAYRSIRAAKDCGADAWKTQWTSDHEAMEMRRGVERGKYKRLQWSDAMLPKLKEECGRVGIEFMCTVFIPQDIPTIARYVKRFKVSAFETKSGDDLSFVKAHKKFKKEVIASTNGQDCLAETIGDSNWLKTLRCVSEYPTPLEKLGLSLMLPQEDSILGLYVPYDGLSDHTTSTLTGAVAVGAGARIIEKHVRLADTPKDDPDWGHSLVLDCGSMDAQGDWGCEGCPNGFHRYVELIREAERML